MRRPRNEKAASTAHYGAMFDLVAKLTAGPYEETNSRLVDSLTIELDDTTNADRLAVARWRKGERLRQQEETHLKARREAFRLWKSAEPAVIHPYLQAKGIQAHGARLYGNLLLIPMVEVGCD